MAGSLRLDCRALSEILAQSCDRLFLEFVPDARRVRHELRGHGADGAIWTMVVDGTKQGVWANWGDPDHQRGDCLELVHWARFPDEQGRRDSYRWALNWLGLSSDAANDLSAAERERAALERVAAARAARTEQEQAMRARKRSRAKATYLDNTTPLFESPQLENYFATRGIALEHLSERPRNLRFSSGKYYDDEHRQVPAMLAAIVHPISRTFLAAHVTYLEERDTRWHNAPLTPKRLVFGPKQGGVIPLLQGASGKRMSSPGDTLLIGEGIENSLAAAMLCQEMHGVTEAPRVWAAVDIGNLAAIELPEHIDTVLLAHDGDDERFGEFRHRIARKWLEEGRSVDHLRPPRGYRDFNDFMVDRSGYCNPGAGCVAAR